MNFTLILQQIINGLSLGAIYSLIAVGFAMVFNILRFSNFAHGGALGFRGGLHHELAGDARIDMSLDEKDALLADWVAARYCV